MPGRIVSYVRRLKRTRNKKAQAANADKAADGKLPVTSSPKPAIVTTTSRKRLKLERAVRVAVD
jgi:hypothetical protein